MATSAYFYLYLRVVRVVNVLDQPLHRCRQSALLLLFDCSDRIDCPVSIEFVRSQLLVQLLQVHRGHIPLVCQDQHYGFPHFRVIHDSVQLLGGKLCSLAVRTVDDIDQGLCFVEVVSPQVAQFLLSSDIPDHEVDGFEMQFFDVESDGRDGVEYFAKFECVEYGGFACAVETEHDYFALSFWEFLGEKAFNQIAHDRYGDLVNCIDYQTESRVSQGLQPRSYDSIQNPTEYLERIEIQQACKYVDRLKLCQCYLY